MSSDGYVDYWVCDSVNRDGGLGFLFCSFVGEKVNYCHVIGQPNQLIGGKLQRFLFPTDQ